MTDFGVVHRINARDIWQNEAQNFTPWLASNINRLGDVLGLDLEVVEIEADVGTFSLDILAKDIQSDDFVIIENQFGDTNHDHLGKVLTYSSHYEAKYIVWISERVRDEHRLTFDWLNQRTDSRTNFFGIELEVIKIDNSKPVPNFNVVSMPNEWGKISLTHKPSAKNEAYRAFFESLLVQLGEKHFITNTRKAPTQSWISFSTGVISGLIYGACFAQGKRARVELYIDTGNKETNKNIFNLLIRNQEEIENELKMTLSWERLEERRASRIALYREGSIDNDEEVLTQIRDWMVVNLLEFKKLFNKKLKKIDVSKI